VIQDLRALLGDLSGPGDMATVLLAGSLGFTVDAGLNAVGFLSPGNVGITAASASLGLKKGWEAAWTQRSRGRRGRTLPPRHRAVRLLRRLEESEEAASDRVKQDLDLFERGLIDGNALNSVIDEALNEIRGREDSASP